jgi:hypothetical protein
MQQRIPSRVEAAVAVASAVRDPARPGLSWAARGREELPEALNARVQVLEEYRAGLREHAQPVSLAMVMVRSPVILVQGKRPLPDTTARRGAAWCDFRSYLTLNFQRFMARYSGLGGLLAGLPYW